MVSSLVIYLLITGSPILTISLAENANIPLGTFITWAGMISLPLTVYWGIHPLRHPKSTWHIALSIGLKVILALGILWVPIAYGLAGNISFTFSESETFQGSQLAMQWFWYLSYGIGIGALLVLVLHWVSRLINMVFSTANAP